MGVARMPFRVPLGPLARPPATAFATGERGGQPSGAAARNLLPQGRLSGIVEKRGGAVRARCNGMALAGFSVPATCSSPRD